MWLYACRICPRPCVRAFSTNITLTITTIMLRWGPMFDPETKQIVHNQDKAYARKACDDALQRLGTDYIDLFTLRGPIQV